MRPFNGLTTWLKLSFYFILILAMLMGLGFIQPVAAQSTAASQTGISFSGSMAITETTDQIMARQQRATQQPQPPTRIANDSGPDFSGKVNNPGSVGLVQGSVTLNPTSIASGPQSIGLNFDGPSAASPCATPPDTMGAVGPTQFITTLNCNFVSYNKVSGAADGVLNASPNTFFATVRGGFSSSDPHIRYDRLSGRWFIVMITVEIPNRIMLAVSSGPTISGPSSWAFFSFSDTVVANRSNCLADYPTPGIDANALYIGVNQYCGASLNTATYLTSDGFVVQKSSLMGAGPVKVTAFPGLYDAVQKVGLFTPQGVDNPDPAATEGYFLGIDGGNWGLLQLRRISHPGNDPASATPPTISGNVTIATPLQNNPLTQPHLGNTGGLSGNIDGSDGRLFEAYLRDGSLWTSLDTGANASCSSSSPDRTAVYWYEITGVASGSTPALRQAGSVCDSTVTATPVFYSYGTIMVNGQGHAAVGYTIAGLSNFTSTGFSGRLKDDPLSTLRGVNIAVAGTHPFNPSFDNGASGSRRWGDYSYVSLDPCDDMTMWSIQEYASANNTYGERITQLKAPLPATPLSAGSVTNGQASVNVVITGSAANGAGFYDTPASLTDPCRTRLSASVSGGVTVNSVTYTDPTHVTLNISTVGASIGPKNVTITNPDGQSAVGTGVLNITSGAPTSTSTTLVSSANPSTFGLAVSFTATVTPASGSVVPSGLVTFTIDSAVAGSTAVSAAGQAVFTTPNLSIGLHTVSAAYGGDANFTASSGALSGGQVVNIGQASVQLSGLSQVYNATPRPVGAVTTPPGLGVVITYNGSSTPPTNAGSYAVAAVVNDPNYNGNASGTLVISKAGTQILLTSSANPILLGQPVTFTATVSSAPGLVVDGQVTISIDGVPTSTPLTGLNVVSKIAPALARGDTLVTAVYLGSSNFLASGPASLTQMVDTNMYYPMIRK